MEETTIFIENFSKKYDGKQTYAVEDFNLVCKAGEIVGLMGHNGAGKSTTLKCLMGMLPFSEGKIEICGNCVRERPLEAKASFGFVTDNHIVFSKMTGMQYLMFLADVYKVPQKKRLERILDLEGVFRLGDSIENIISSYSHGMKQKICMMGSLIHEPKVWILDEPMLGLDPRTMKSVLEFMRGYAEKGNTILFSTHNIYSVTKVCDRVVVLKGGKLVKEVRVREFLEKNSAMALEEFLLNEE